MATLILRPTELSAPWCLDICSLFEFPDVRSLVLTNCGLPPVYAVLSIRLYQRIPTSFLHRIIDTANLSAFKRILEHGLDVKAHERLDALER
jgi:hypothetical protein